MGGSCSPEAPAPLCAGYLGSLVLHSTAVNASTGPPAVARNPSDVRYADRVGALVTSSAAFWP